MNPEQPNYHPGENSALMDYYAPSSGNSLPKFRDNLQVPSSSVKNPKRIEFLTPEDGIDGLPERWVMNYQYSLCINP